MTSRKWIQQKLGWDKTPSPATPSTKKKNNQKKETTTNNLGDQTNSIAHQTTLKTNKNKITFEKNKEWTLSEKSDDYLQVISQNIDGIPISRKSAKSVNILKTLSDSTADVWLLQETNPNWRAIPE